MIQVLLMILISGFVLVLAVLSILPFYIIGLFAILAFISNNAMLGIILTIIAIAKLNIKNNINREGSNFEFRFYDSTDRDNFNYEYQKRQEEYQRYNEYQGFNVNNNINEYENACKIIGADVNEPYEEKRKKYMKLVKKYHPDLNDSKEAEEKLKKINTAFDIIEKYEKN